MSADHDVYRPRGSRVLSFALITVAMLAGIMLAVQGGPLALLRYGWPLLAAAWFVWLLYENPRVRVTEGFVEVHNILRRHRVPWNDIRQISTRYTLTLNTHSVGTIRCWAAPAPGIHTAATMRREEFGPLGAVPGGDKTGRGGPGDFGAGRSGVLRPSDNPGTASGALALVLLQHWRGAGEPDATVRTVSRWQWPLITVSALLLVAAALSLLALP